MQEKKKSSNWYIAATHYLTAGFAIPLVIGLVITLLIGVVPLSFLLNPFLLMLFLLIIRILAIWLGTMYSANYLKKTYIIEDKDKIINLATIYFVVLNLGYLFIQIFGFVGGKLLETDLIYYFFGFITSALLFFIFSRKYVENTEVESQL